MTLQLNEIQFSMDDDPSPQGEQRLNVDESLSFSAGFGTPGDVELDGFNEYGVRENNDEDDNLRSVDVVYEAMEPGNPDKRNGVKVTREFLENVADKDYSNNPPYMLGHSDQPLDEIGKVQKVWFDERTEKLMVMNRVFATGSPTHEDVIKRLTYDPPTMTDGSVGFGDQYEAVMNEDGEPELVDGTVREFSTTPFPAGYDDGGLGVPNTAFSEAVVEATNFDDEEEDDSSENLEFDTAVSTETISL